MILSWMAYAMLCAALCAVAGVCVDAALRHRVRQRRLIWMAAMLASVVLPLAIPLFISKPQPVAAPTPLSVMVPVINESVSATAATPKRSVDWGQLAIALWITSSLLLAGSLIVSSTRLNRRLRGYRTTRIDGQSLLVSDDFGPAVVGLLRPQIVLPAWALTLTDNERRLVVSHELEHQRAGDPAVTIAALFAVALFPWNMALWWQLSRLRLAIEFDCDARVVTRCGADPFAYGNLLLTAHENAGQTRLAVLGLAPIRSALGKRVNALVVRGAESRRRAFGAIGVAMIALCVLGFAPVPTLPRSVLDNLTTAILPENATTSALGSDSTEPIVPTTSLSQSLSNSQRAPSTSVRLNEVAPRKAASNASMRNTRKAGGATQPDRGAASTYSMSPPTNGLRDAAANVIVRAQQPNSQRVQQQRSSDSVNASIITAVPRADSVQSSPAPAGNTYSARPVNGSFGTMVPATMRPSDATVVAPGAVINPRGRATMVGGGAASGGRGGTSSNEPPLKTYTGGFMNAEVPARADSVRPPIR